MTFSYALNGYKIAYPAEKGKTMAKLNLTEEEKEERRKALHRARQMKYRIKKGDLSVGRPRGRTRNDEEIVSVSSAAGVVLHQIQKKEKEWRPMPKAILTKDSKLEDLLPWCMEVAEELRQSPNPAAWASSLNSVLKILEFLDKKIPPTLPDVKPRPRQIIVIDDEEKDDEE